MKRNLILTLLACGAGVALYTVAQAQSPSPSTSPSVSGTTGAATGPGGHHGGGLLGHLAHALQLSGTQQAEIEPILEAAQPQLKAIHDQAKAQVDALVNSVGNQIAPLLTGTQQAKLGQIVQNIDNGQGMGGRGFGPRGRFGRQGGPGGRGGPGGFGGPGAGGKQLKRLTAELGLSTDQENQIKPILTAAHTQVTAIFANNSLAPDQKFAQAKETMDAAHSQISGLLTPQQQAQFAALKGQGQGHRRFQGPGGQSPASGSVSGTSA